MNEEKKCKTCAYFPCYKTCCNLGNKEGCEDYKSITRKAIEDIHKK